MKIMHEVPLALYSTMRLGGKANYLVHVRGKEELLDALDWADRRELSVLMIGSGSNIIWRDEGFNGLVVVNEFPGYEVTNEDDKDYFIRVGAGENWDGVVARSVADNASGIEALSLIPGTAGATPVQNVGAYGQEISQTLDSVEAYDRETRNFIILSNKECGFNYRSSIFNTTAKGRYFITYLNFHLYRTHMQPPFYSSLQDYLSQRNITNYSPQNIRKAVYEIRTSKLPDPAKIANNGSFFANPVIDQDAFNELAARYPDIKHWPTNDGKYKLSAAWLIEKAGFKDMHDHETGMATWFSQPLILVNESAKTTNDLMIFKKKIVDIVQEIFNVTLSQEPELLP
jgi:UDP-N-acetylmuramate dehydrogenase